MQGTIKSEFELKTDLKLLSTHLCLGHYQFKVMGFGLCNAPAIFQALMNQVLRTYLRKFVLVFLDDILIFSKNWKEHLEHVRLVLQSVLENRLYCKPKKCVWRAKEIRYLEHFLSGTLISPDSNKLQAVKDWPTSTTTIQVRSFLDFANYFRRFVKQFADWKEHTLSMERWTARSL